MEISKPFAAILGILVALFAGYSLASILADAVNGLLPIGMIAQLAALKVLISLEVLIPISLYIAVVLAFGRLSCGFRDDRHVGPGHDAAPARPAGADPRRRPRGHGFLPVAGRAPLGLCHSHAITERAAAMLNVNAMEAGTFYVGQMAAIR